MLERISEWFKHLPKCSRLDSPSELSDVYNMIPLNRNNCFPPGNSKKKEKEKTELYLTWYAKDKFFECYHKKGSKLLDKPWKSMVISPYEFNNISHLIFVDMCTLQHRVFNLPEKTLWGSPCNIMFEKESRPAKLFTNYKHPFNSRDFEFFAQSFGYVLCGWNSHKFLQKQIQYFKESYEIVDKIKYILSHSSTVEYDLTLLQYFVRRNLPPEEGLQSCLSGHNESEDTVEKTLGMERDEETETLSSREDKFEYGSIGYTTKDGGSTRNRKFDQPFNFNKDSSKTSSKRSKLKQGPRSENIIKKNSIKLNSIDSVQTMPFSSSVIGSASHHISENKKLKNAFVKSIYKNKINENKTSTNKKWECILLDLTAKDDMFYYIFMDADSCYPQVMESECCDEASCKNACNRFLERHVDSKEFHVPLGKPFDTEELKNYLEMKGIECYFNSPLFQYLKKPRAVFSVIKRIISRNYNYEERSKVLSEFVKKKIIMRNTFARRNCSTNEVCWKGKRIIAVEMANEDGNYLLFIDLEKVLVDVYPKKPNGRFIFPQEMIVTFVEAFNDLGIPKELHTIGSTLFESPEFKHLIEYCHIKHCSDCWHVEERTRYFKMLEKIQCCFSRTSNVESGLLLWQSLRKRLEIRTRTKQKRVRKSCLNQQKKHSKGRGINIYRHSKNGSDSHLLSYVVGQALWEMNHKKHKDKNKDFPVKNTVRTKDLTDLSKINKSNNINFSVKREAYSGRIEAVKYQEMLNQILKRGRTRNNDSKRKTRSNEKFKKNQSKSVSKCKKKCSVNLCSFN